MLMWGQPPSAVQSSAARCLSAGAAARAADETAGVTAAETTTEAGVKQRVEQRFSAASKISFHNRASATAIAAEISLSPTTAPKMVSHASTKNFRGMLLSWAQSLANSPATVPSHTEIGYTGRLRSGSGAASGCVDGLPRVTSGAISGAAHFA